MRRTRDGSELEHHEPSTGRKSLARPGHRLQCVLLTFHYTSEHRLSAILDTKPLTNGQIPIEYCIRPFLHQFLEDVYSYYDIVIWSQTHWQWIDIKLSEMGMLQTDRKYKVTFILDKGPMFLVYSKRNDELYKHHVKPLEVIWRKAIGKWDASNTVHIDDLSRNFALNTENGLKVKAFKDASQLGLQASRDRELLLLSRYLIHIAESGKDFRSFDFKVSFLYANRCRSTSLMFSTELEARSA